MLVPKLDKDGNEQFDDKGERIMFDDGKVDTPKMHTDAAFKDVSNDMHKYKKQKQVVELENEKLKKQISDKDTQQKVANEEYKELWQAEVDRGKKLEADRDADRDKFIDVHKKQAVIEKLGSFKRSEYNNFIDTSKIIVDSNGVVDEMTVDVEVKRLKQEYPELLKRSRSSIPPNDAPESGNSNINKPLNKMNADERAQLRTQLITDRLVEEKNNQ